MERFVSEVANKVIMQERIEEVKLQLLDGMQRYEIVQLGSKKWNITEQQVDSYIRKAKKQICKHYEPIVGKEIQKHIARRERLLQMVLKKGEEGTQKSLKEIYLALKIDDSLAKLKGLLIDKVILPFESKRVEIIDEGDEKDIDSSDTSINDVSQSPSDPLLPNTSPSEEK